MRLFEEEQEKKINSIPKVKPGEDIIINNIPFLNTAVSSASLIKKTFRILKSSTIISSQLSSVRLVFR